MPEVSAIEFPDTIRRAGDALRYCCDQLYASGIDNFIHYDDKVSVTINGSRLTPVIDFANHRVIFNL